MEPLKDQFFNKKYVETLAADMTAADKKFPCKAFVASVLDHQWKNLELKARMHHLADSLHAALNRDYSSAIKLLTPLVRKRIREKTNSFGDMVFPDFVERFGLDDFKTSVLALEQFTAACSSEFAVRPFIVRYPKEMMQVMLNWSGHASEHVRRLASEGCRPRLPWGMALTEFKRDPAVVLKILENLKDDPSEYVRRSVANNLNDISKDNLPITLQIAERWFGKTANTDALIRHALRNELKKGNPRALKLFSLAPTTKARIEGLKIAPTKIKIGEAAWIEFVLTIRTAQRLRLEYWVFFVKSGGGVSKKVFQISEREFADKTEHAFRKKHRFQNFTTRKHYTGAHKIVIAVNGEPKAEATVALT